MVVTELRSVINLAMDGAPVNGLLQRQPFWHSSYEPDAVAGAAHTITVTAQLRNRNRNRNRGCQPFVEQTGLLSVRCRAEKMFAYSSRRSWISCSSASLYKASLGEFSEGE